MGAWPWVARAARAFAVAYVGVLFAFFVLAAVGDVTADGDHAMRNHMEPGYLQGPALERDLGVIGVLLGAALTLTPSPRPGFVWPAARAVVYGIAAWLMAGLLVPDRMGTEDDRVDMLLMTSCAIAAALAAFLWSSAAVAWSQARRRETR